MNVDNSPSIAEKLEYLKICDVAIETYEKLKEDSRYNSNVCFVNNQTPKSESFKQQYSEYKNLKEHYSKLKVAIAMDLCKNPKFIKYSENLGYKTQALQTISKQPANQTVEVENIESPSIGKKIIY